MGFTKLIGVRQNMISDKGGGGVSQFLIFSDKGGEGHTLDKMFPDHRNQIYVNCGGVLSEILPQDCAKYLRISANFGLMNAKQEDKNLYYLHVFATI